MCDCDTILPYLVTEQERTVVANERGRYRARRDYAMENSDRVASIVIDGMDQNHCIIPNLGTTHSTETIPQHITGILEHTNAIVNPSDGQSDSKIYLLLLINKLQTNLYLY